MATDEEYLDNLLKSLNESEQQPRTMEEVMRGVTKNSNTTDPFSVTSEDLADMLDEIEKNDHAQHMIEEIEDEITPAGIIMEEEMPAEDESKKEIAEEELWDEENKKEIIEEEPWDEENKKEITEEKLWEEESKKEIVEEQGEEDNKEEIVEEEPEKETEEEMPDEEKTAEYVSEDDDWQNSLEALLAEADAQAKEEQKEAEKEERTVSDFDNMDVTELIDHMDNTDADLAEINGLLKKADSNEAVEDDMLALLENVKDISDDSSNSGNNDAFDIFAEENQWENQEAAEGSGKNSEEGKSKRKKKEKSPKKKLFGKKKNNISTENENSVEDISSIDGIIEEKQKDKKPGFFSRMITLLTQEDEELAAFETENEEILRELDEEDRKKAQKQEKKKKKADKKKSGKKKGGNEEQSKEGEEGLEEDIEEGGKKKKKKEKKKKEKPPKEKIKEKPVKVLSRKNLMLLVAACATLIAGILVLSIFLPEFADKKNARRAFYEGNYETTYKLLYDKKLNSSDSIIFNRVKTVLTIERKLNAYQNNLSLNRELEALDALIQGVVCYQELSGVDEYGGRNEVDAIYQKICSLLQENYGISPEDAAEINTYDNETYTRKLDSVINGTEFLMPGEEKTEEPLPPQDVLPEEEEFISY